MRKILILASLILVPAVVMSADIPQNRIMNAVYKAVGENTGNLMVDLSVASINTGVIEVSKIDTGVVDVEKISSALPAGTNKIGALSDTTFQAVDLDIRDLGAGDTVGARQHGDWTVTSKDEQLTGKTWSYSAGERTASGTFTISGYVVSGWIAMDSSTSGTTCTFRLNQGDLKEIKSGEVENFKFPVYPATLPINIEYLAPAGRIRYHFDKVS